MLLLQDFCNNYCSGIEFPRLSCSREAGLQTIAAHMLDWEKKHLKQGQIHDFPRRSRRGMFPSRMKHGICNRVFRRALIWSSTRLLRCYSSWHSGSPDLMAAAGSCDISGMHQAVGSSWPEIVDIIGGVWVHYHEQWLATNLAAGLVESFHFALPCKWPLSLPFFCYFHICMWVLGTAVDPLQCRCWSVRDVPFAGK